MHPITIVTLPRVRMAGAPAPQNAHIEVGAHGLALFLSNESPLPVMDIDGTREELRAFVDRLAMALRDPETAAERVRRDAWDLSS
jgi:hypothetical protein